LKTAAILFRACHCQVRGRPEYEFIFKKLVRFRIEITSGRPCAPLERGISWLAKNLFNVTGNTNAVQLMHFKEIINVTNIII
jgi:hypothetical protein